MNMRLKKLGGKTLISASHNRVCQIMFFSLKQISSFRMLNCGNLQVKVKLQVFRN